MSSSMVTEYAAMMPSHASDTRWYAIRTRSRHEKAVEKQLRTQGIIVFLPMLSQWRRWSDRRKLVQVPVFAGYAFVRIAACHEARLKVLRTHGVVSFVGTTHTATSIPQEQIEAVKTLILSNEGFTSHPFLKVGQRVRVNGGSLDGMEGILVAQNGMRNLVISVEAIQRSLSIRVEGYTVEAV